MMHESGNRGTIWAVVALAIGLAGGTIPRCSAAAESGVGAATPAATPGVTPNAAGRGAAAQLRTIEGEVVAVGDGGQRRAARSGAGTEQGESMAAPGRRSEVGDAQGGGGKGQGGGGGGKGLGGGGGKGQGGGSAGDVDATAGGAAASRQGPARENDPGRLLPGQFLLRSESGEVVVDMGRRQVEESPKIEVGDRVAVTGMERSVGRRAVLRATKVVRGNDTYEIGRGNPRRGERGGSGERLKDGSRAPGGAGAE